MNICFLFIFSINKKKHRKKWFPFSSLFFLLLLLVTQSISTVHLQKSCRQAFAPPLSIFFLYFCLCGFCFVYIFESGSDAMSETLRAFTRWNDDAKMLPKMLLNFHLNLSKSSFHCQLLLSIQCLQRFPIFGYKWE